MPRAINTAGLAYYVSRQRLSNQERMDQPLQHDRALAIASHPKVSADGRILALHCAIDYAWKVKVEEGTAIFDKVVEILQTTFKPSEVPIRLLDRIADAIPCRPGGQWVQQQLDQRTSEALDRDRHAA